MRVAIVTALTTLAAVAGQAAMATPQTHDQKTASTSLVVEKYASLSIQPNALNMKVLSSFIGNPGDPARTQHAIVQIVCNYDTTLRAPTSVILTRNPAGPGGPYTVNSNVSLTTSDEGSRYEDPSHTHWLLDIPRGSYSHNSSEPSVDLNVGVAKEWGPTDIAGTYTGSLTLELIPRVP